MVSNPAVGPISTPGLDVCEAAALIMAMIARAAG